MAKTAAHCCGLMEMDASKRPRHTAAKDERALLLKRVFALDLTHCSQYGGPLAIIAAIEDPAVISKILTHLGVPSRAPSKAPVCLDAFFL